MGSSFRFVCLLVLLSSCGTRPERARTIGEAYAGPAILKLRQEINPRSAVVATVKHGERLGIIQRRRKFLKVRTPSGVEGWTDENLLLSRDEITELKNLAQRAKTLPSQGVATTFDVLNLHTQPYRSSPSFLQVKEGEKVEVIGHRVTPRTLPPRQPLVPATAQPVKSAPKKKSASQKLPPPPMPLGPKPPDNWLELSGPRPAAVPVQAEPAPVPTDDWSLTRTSAGQCGWVLTRRLFMAIPDDVAQYAEGRRITSYFSLGEVRDGEAVKHHWLWTTAGQGLAEGRDFDSFRVFIWSLRRRRYETAYIERNVKGYFPVLVQHPGFSVCLEKKDGLRYRRNYAFLGNIVRFAREAPCEATGQQPALETPLVASAETSATAEPFSIRFKRRVGELRRRWLGR